MFIAIDKNGRRINILEGLLDGRTSFFCPACKQELILKQGLIKQAHFAHRSLTEHCEGTAEAEGPEHLGLKLALYDWVADSELEVYLPEIQQTADLLIGERIAIEIQCSSLSISRLRERTLHYREAEIPVVWLLGERLWLKDRLSRLQEQFLYFSEQRGFYCWELDLARACLRLKSLIYQDLQGRLYHLTEEFSFGSRDFLEVLRIPYIRQKLQKLPIPEISDQKAYLERALYYRSKAWMELQEAYYLQGKHLLEQDFSRAYLAPPGLNLLALDAGAERREFIQLEQDLTAYYENFSQFFHQEKADFLYPPAYYAIINRKLKREED
ncbi:competence protein CoiA [Lactococcus termiticola]|uniref:Competence protein CoiA n=1 Tax=Lactococcus termiticola TaxID=2169526 RepID=A0A2R5HCV7_9LACT|nr:competence protein CoiA family protein [Lactococcus termiticola]GBG95923.1 competence protein CoiA [Lactococcus termiticola]